MYSFIIINITIITLMLLLLLLLLLCSSFVLLNTEFFIFDFVSILVNSV